MAAERNFRPLKRWKLKEEETITSFSSWHSNIEYHLSLNNEFARFLTSEWSKKSVMNRGLQPDTEAVVPVAADRKTDVQKNLILEQMLNLIAQFAPSLLGKDIVKNSTSLKCIWQRIRRYYAFSQSECNFLKLSLIRRKHVDEELENAMLTAQISTTLRSKSVDTTIEVKKVQCDASPYFYAFYEHHPCHVVVDTGATSSLISKSFLTVAGVKMKPT